MRRREFIELAGTGLSLYLMGCESQNSSPPPNPTPGLKSQTWEIQSVDSMKETKDRVRDPRSDDFIKSWADTAVELGATHVAIDTPMDNPTGGSSIDYTARWLEIVRDRDPQKSTCLFSDQADFNSFLQRFIQESDQSLSAIGLSNLVDVGYFGFDGYITAGVNNPDWQGKTAIEQQTLAAMKNVLAIDHYSKTPQMMEPDLKIIRSVWPNSRLFISEWGAGQGESPEEIRTVFQAIRNSGPVLGVNYWHLGMGGKEALINEDFTKKPQFYEVQAWFKGQR